METGKVVPQRTDDQQDSQDQKKPHPLEGGLKGLGRAYEESLLPVMKHLGVELQELSQNGQRGLLRFVVHHFASGGTGLNTVMVSGSHPSWNSVCGGP